MADFMPSAFTAADRRKKAVTYGKSSRLPPKPSLFQRDEAPSPERPRKQTAPSSVAPSQDEQQCASTRPRSPDIFDVPSEDDVISKPTRPTKKLPMKRKLLADSAPQQHQKATSILAHPSKPVPELKLPPQNATAPFARTGRPTHTLPKPSNTNSRAETAQHAKTNIKGDSEAATAKLVASKPQKKYHKKLEVSVKSKPRTGANQQPLAQEVDIFDIPPSDDESHMTTPKPLARSKMINARKQPINSSKPDKDKSTTDTAESDESNASYKRKRTLTGISNTKTKSHNEGEEDASMPQRSRKHQKKEEPLLLAQEPSKPHPSKTFEKTSQLEGSVISKPRRTRIRTVPVISRTQIVKGQSSPAVLHTMLPEKSSDVPPQSDQEAMLDEETMYDIPEPAQSSYTSPSGSVTPRQKALFGSLLGMAASPSTPMPNISKLNLTAKKPSSLLGALSRSKSDLTPSANPRHTKLICRLKEVDNQSEEEMSGSESNSESEGASDKEEDKEIAVERHIIDHTNQKQDSRKTSQAMDIDAPTGESQTSQTASDFNSRHKFTYAKSRSYLQEANPEDALFMAMDLDDNIGFGSQKHNMREEESEEEEASQVRAIHELKRQGQQNTFEWEMLIDDMSGKSSASVRRSAILEFCSKMADDAFTSELLDSTLSQRFLRNVSTRGEIIFDFATLAATIFMLQTKPTHTMIEQIHESISTASIQKFLDNDRDILKVARDRKTNLSRISQESVTTFRNLVQEHAVWSPHEPVIMSPQVLALKAIELYVLGARKSGNVTSYVDQNAVSKLASVAAKSCENLKIGRDSPHNDLVLDMVFSILEAASLVSQQHPYWPTSVLESLAQSMSISIDLDNTSTVMLAAKLCMNLTNNKPKACRQFSNSNFIQSCGRAIIRRFEELRIGVAEPRRTQVLDSLILSLGTMINLTEHSDAARVHVDDGNQLLENLAKVFLEGSARSAQAGSMEESQSSVAVGYLSVLLGNVCLNREARDKIRIALPNQNLSILVEKIKEFINVHEHLNRAAKEYEGDEGQQTWQDYTSRLLQVVKSLERVV